MVDIEGSCVGGLIIRYFEKYTTLAQSGLEILIKLKSRLVFTEERGPWQPILIEVSVRLIDGPSSRIWKVHTNGKLDAHRRILFGHAISHQFTLT